MTTSNQHRSERFRYTKARVAMPQCSLRHRVSLRIPLRHPHQSLNSTPICPRPCPSRLRTGPSESSQRIPTGQCTHSR